MMTFCDMMLESVFYKCQTFQGQPGASWSPSPVVSLVHRKAGLIGRDRV